MIAAERISPPPCFRSMKNRSTASAILAIACAGMLAASAACAATARPDDATPPAPPNDEHGVRPSEGTSAPRGDLSDELSRSGGVIKPRTDIDRDMRQGAPDPGPQSMPVIPPPGTPGNNLDVKPK
jgi:hypothetical protein